MMFQVPTQPMCLTRICAPNTVPPPNTFPHYLPLDQLGPFYWPLDSVTLITRQLLECNRPCLVGPSSGPSAIIPNPVPITRLSSSVTVYTR